MAANDGLRWATLDVVLNAVKEFLDPLLSGEVASWEPIDWSWS
jgi:hypothetical protein